MSVYGVNYVFCEEKLKDNLMLETDYEQRLYQNSIYEPEAHKLDNDRYLVIFETRGHNFHFDQIHSIIRKFPNSTWHFMHESRSDLVTFSWKRKLVHQERIELADADNNCLLSLYYTDMHFRSLKHVHIYEDCIVIDEILKNEKSIYNLSSQNATLFKTFADCIVDEMFTADSTGCFALSKNDPVWIYLWLFKSDQSNHVQIENNDNEFRTEDDLVSGRYFSNKILTFLKTILEESGANSEVVFDSVQAIL